MDLYYGLPLRNGYPGVARNQAAATPTLWKEVITMSFKENMMRGLAMAGFSELTYVNDSMARTMTELGHQMLEEK